MNEGPFVAESVPAYWFIQRGSGSFEMNFASVGTIGPDAPVPNDRFYVHNRAMPPDINAEQWRLHVRGVAVSAAELTFAEILALPQTTTRCVIDCGANGRSFFPKLPAPEYAPGWLPVGFTEWRWGAMGAAEWTGVLLTDLLDHVGIDWTKATYTCFRGADEIAQGDGSTQPYAHVFDTPLANAGILLAYTMNGVALPRDHGHPLRAVVPGMGGNTSVKWLTEILVSHEPILWTPLQRNQTLWGPKSDPPQPPPPMLPKSAFELAWDGTIVLSPVGGPITIYGRAWTSASTILGVEVAIERLQPDGSWRSIFDWQPARLLTAPQPQWWTRFSFDWKDAQPGAYRLRSRATDILGNSQPAPEAIPWNQHGLHYNATAPHPITLLPLQDMP